MKKVVRTDDWAESGLFKSEEDYKEFTAKIRKKLEREELFERIRNCPKKKRTPVYCEDTPKENQDHHHDVKRETTTEYYSITSKTSSTSDHKNDNNDNDNNNNDNIKINDDVKKQGKRPRRADEEDLDHHDKCKEKRQRKKAAMDRGPEPAPEMPRWVREAVEERGGHGERLLIQKGLTKSDVEGGQNRISMPVRQLRTPDDFLTEEELRNVLRRKDDDDKHFNGLDVVIVEPYSRTSTLSLRKWDYGSSSSYVFASKELKEFIKRNGLKAGDDIQIWFFRCNDGSPCFALVNVTAETASSSSSNSNSSSVVVPVQENHPTS